MADLPDGMEAYKVPSGKWRWSYQSSGGSFYLSPRAYASKAAASKAAGEWYDSFVETELQ